VPSAAGEDRRRKTAAGPGKQMAPCPDWTHHESIGGGGVTEGGSGERRRRGRGGAHIAARVPTREGNARQQAAVGASLGPSGDAGQLGRRWKLAEGVLAVAAAADDVLARELQQWGYL
jgi:hypothetical protein